MNPLLYGSCSKLHTIPSALVTRLISSLLYLFFAPDPLCRVIIRPPLLLPKGLFLSFNSVFSKGFLFNFFFNINECLIEGVEAFCFLKTILEIHHISLTPQ